MSDLGECIEFVGHKAQDGYGVINRSVNGKKKKIRAHRFAYAEVYGAIPDGLFVCHKCDNPICVNVEHLFLGTNADNVRDMMEKGRHRSLKGNACSWARLTEGDIPRIRDMLACGCSNTDIGKWFGVSQGAISDIKRGRTWGHVA